MFVFALMQKEPKKSRIVNSLRSNSTIRPSRPIASGDLVLFVLHIIFIINVFAFL